MKRIKITYLIAAFFCLANSAVAQDAQLHVNPKWKECSFQLDPSLSQKAWNQFTKEAALVAYFRPLIDAKPMGKWNVEISLLQWQTAIDDTDAAWNDTFVHPDSAHWLTEGPRLGFPGITARVGISKRVDLAFYFTKNPHANYGFYAGQLQYNLINNIEKHWSLSARLNYSSLFGPADLTLNVIGLDVLASKEFAIRKWFSVSPYAGVSSFLTNAHETTDAVNLHDEHIGASQAMVGAVVKLSIARLGVEYNFAQVDTFSFKIGVSF